MDAGRSRCRQVAFIFYALSYLLLERQGASGQLATSFGMQQQTAFGIRPLIGHTVATATGAVRGAASRVGNAIGAAVAASTMVRPSSRYVFERSGLQNTLANYPATTPYSIPAGPATFSNTYVPSSTAVSRSSAAPQIARVPVPHAAYGTYESHLRGMEQQLPSPSPLTFSRPFPPVAPLPPDAVYAPVDINPSEIGAFTPDAFLLGLVPAQHLHSHTESPKLRASLQSSSSVPASVAAVPGGPVLGTANLSPAVAADAITPSEGGRLMDAQGLNTAVWPRTGSQAMQSLAGFSGFAAQASQQPASEIVSNPQARHHISIYDALTLAEKVVVPSIEAIAKVAPALPLSREGEKLRGRLFNKTDEVVSDLNAPPVQSAHPTKTERRPRLYIPQVQTPQPQLT